MSSKEIKVFAPATVANVACGFDVLGLAVENPGDEITIKLSDKPGIRIEKITGDKGRLPKDPLSNTASISIIKMQEQLGIQQGMDIILNKKMPLGSGLGSSAASTVAGVFAANELLGKPFKTEELLPFAMEGERIACGSAHADNVAPALMGGFVLVRSYAPLDAIKLPTPEDLWCTIIHPRIEVQTKDARNILRKQVLLQNAVEQWGNLAGLITGLFTSDYDLISRSLSDVIVEPIRSILIPGFDAAKSAALDAGVLGAGISGSGPSIFALSKDEKTARQAGEDMQVVFSSLAIGSDIYVSKVNPNGPVVLD